MSVRGSLFLIAVFFVPACFAQVEPAATIDALRIGTWNLLNLFDNNDDPYLLDEGTEPKAHEEIRALAAVMDLIDADILAVQEVENRGILEYLNSRLAKPYLYVELLEGNDVRGIDVGLLSRFPIVQTTSFRHDELDGRYRFARDFPLFRVRPADGLFIDVGVVHLKSKRGDKAESNAWRAAEVSAIRRIVDDRRKQNPAIPVVVCGDFNDTPAALVLKPLFEVLDDTTVLIPDAERFSYVFQNNREMIDLILATKDLKASGARALHIEANPSDHRPVVVEFDLGRPLVRPVVAGGKAFEGPERPVFDAGDLNGLGRRFLKEVTIRGKVVHVHRPRSGRGASLNFHEDYTKAIVVYIPPDAEKEIGDIEALKGRAVSVSGPVSRHQGRLQIKLTRRDQLQLK